MVEINGKNTSKNVSGKYSKKLLDYAKQSATDALKNTFRKLIKNEYGKEIPKKDIHLQKKYRK